ncbi:hypothetical protein [Sorangium sp. So ce1151]|uniref:hypothetical protein n=1 Tax=Sorangium sp. So ce1151 TaxID=3133332 RepID=UPI003F5FDA98
MSACVTLDEVLAAARARCASLVPETSGYLALAVGDATSRLPLRLDDRAVLLTTEGTVTVRSRGEPVAPAEAARLLRDLLARLLAASAGSMPNLAATARPRPTAEQDPDAVARELEAALIPVNRNAARRALARLARETLRAREAGRLKRARAEVQAAPAANEKPAAPVAPACAAAAPRDEVGGAQRGEVAAAPLASTVVELTLSPGPVAPAIVELTLSPGLVAYETAGPTLLAPALGSGSDEIAARAAVVEPSPEVALAPAHATHPGEQAEAFPEPTPTVVQAAVEIETAAALVEIPVVPELVEPARAVARVAPIAPSAPAIVPADGRAIPALSPADGDGAACREALTSPEGIEALLIELSPAPTEIVSLPQEPTPSESILVELSPDPAGVVTLSQEPTPSESILVELSPDPAGVVTLSQEPTPTVATAVWEERVAADSAEIISVTEAPVDATDAAADVPADVVDAATEPPADVVDAATEPPADVVDAATEPPADVVDAATEPPADVAADDIDAAADVIDAAANVVDAAAEPPADIIDAAADAPADIIDAAADAPADVIDAAANVVDAAAEPPADIIDAAADAPADIIDAAADAPAGVPCIAPDAVETARPPAIHFLLEAEAGLQVTPAYGGWPLIHHRDAAAVSIGPRASVASLEETVASLEETPAARHTLPWPIPAQRGDDAPAAAAPAPHTAAPAPAPAEEPCPAGLSPIDAIVWSASRRSRSAPPPADGAGTSRVDELVARFVAQSEHSAQRRAARSMKALAGLDLTLTPPPVAARSATAARALPDARSPLADTRRPVPSEVLAPDVGQVAVGESSRPPVPLVTPRRRGLSLWLALVALALLCAVLVGALRPELFASLAEPLARCALRAVPRAEARTPPPHD